jgi:outer membrane protein assembly factor BamD (BamD/ComL family)
MKGSGFFALAFLCMVTATAPAADTIRTLDDSHRGDIVTMSQVQIELRDKDGLRTEIPCNEIVNISYDDEPDELRDARTQIRSGSLNEAIQMLRGINLEQITNEYVKKEIQFYTAFCVGQLALGGFGQVQDAQKLIGTFIAQNKNHYKFFEATELYGDLTAALEDYVRATRAYDVLAGAPWPDAKLRATLAKARVLALQGKHTETVAAFEQVLNAGVPGPQADRYRIMATTGKAASLAAINQGQAGLKLVEGIIKSAQKGDTEIHALAYNAQGDCYRVMGNPKAAALAYLHTDALYYQHPALHAEALARLATLWESMEQPDRMASAKQKLQKQYPNSKWAR